MSPVPEGEGHIHLLSSGIITAHGCSQTVLTALFAYFYNVREDAYSPVCFYSSQNTGMGVGGKVRIAELCLLGQVGTRLVKAFEER